MVKKHTSKEPKPFCGLFRTGDKRRPRKGRVFNKDMYAYILKKRRENLRKKRGQKNEGDSMK